MTTSPRPKCGVEIDDSKPFIRCDRDDCPEKSGKSLLGLALGECSGCLHRDLDMSDEPCRACKKTDGYSLFTPRQAA